MINISIYYTIIFSFPSIIDLHSDGKSSERCPNDWHLTDNSCYLVVWETRLDYHGAADSCMGHGAHLAWLEEPGEMYRLVGVILQVN